VWGFLAKLRHHPLRPAPLGSLLKSESEFDPAGALGTVPNGTITVG
jgi:hypothetical protein